jgi:hypothetical protein
MRLRLPAISLLAAFLAASYGLVSAYPQTLATGDPPLQTVVDRMAAYVAAYGAQTSFVVAVEKYTQQVTVDEKTLRPRSLLSEYAIVKADDKVGWTGFRDVVEVDGRQVTDRRDRLERLFTGPAGGEGELRRIANESARYNVGPIARNLNVPTTALFFLHPARVARFAFSQKGTKTIDGVKTWVLDFRESARPTLVMKRDGSDVPCEGTVWVVPEDGTVVRTRMRLRNFANTITAGGTVRSDPSRLDRVVAEDTSIRQMISSQPAQPQQPSTPGTPSGGGSQPTTPATGVATGATAGTAAAGSQAEQNRRGSNAAGVDDMTGPEGLREIETLADIEVTYRRDASSGLWLPAQMTELYDGPITLGTRAPMTGRAVGRATYSDFKRFETSVKIVIPR